MNMHLKIGLITLHVRARRAVRVPEQKFLVPLPFKIGLITYTLMATPLTYAEELGRLFFTPEQRMQLEYSQQQDDNAPGNTRSLTVNGIVQKHGGERTVWINGVPQLAGKSDERAPESLPVAVPGQSQPVKVKVGQKVLLNSPPQHNPAKNKPSRQTSPESDD